MQAYTPQTWTDGSTATPLSAARLTVIESGIAAIAARAQGAVVVASADMPQTVKDAADFVCDGTGDQVEINAAIDVAAPLQSRNALMPAGAQQRGKVVLTGGRFSCSGPVLMRTGVHLAGSGWGTEVRSVGVTSAGLIQLADVNDHAMIVSDLYLYGNWSAGGSCSAIDFDSTGSVNSGGVANYPSTSPDNYYIIRDLLIDAFTGGASSVNRHGIYLHGGGYHRGPMVSGCTIRNIGGSGIFKSSASDGFIERNHIGTVGGSGIRVSTGNCKLANNKTFYCDTYGLYVTSGRGTCVGFESQDDATGVYVDAGPFTLSGITIDTWSPTGSGLRIGSDRVVVAGFNAFWRSGGRYITSGNGLQWDAGITDCRIDGIIDPTSLAASTSGTPGARVYGNIVRAGVDILTYST